MRNNYLFKTHEKFLRKLGLKDAFLVRYKNDGYCESRFFTGSVDFNIRVQIMIQMFQRFLENLSPSMRLLVRYKFDGNCEGLISLETSVILLKRRSDYETTISYYDE